MLIKYSLGLSVVLGYNYIALFFNSDSSLDKKTKHSEFILQSCYYVHFWANTLRKGMNPFILPAMG